MKSLIGLILGILCLPLFAGCDEVAFGSQEDFTPKWSALAAAQMLDATPANPVTPVKPGICSNCNGKGKVGDGTVMVTCAVCGGDGRIEGFSADQPQCANPLCKCENCKGQVCTCEPLKVASLPDVLTLSGGSVTKATASPPAGLFVPVKHDQPQVCQLPQKTAAPPPVAAGRWETVHAGFRGRRSYQVWVPAAGACSAGNCSPGLSSSFGGCRSCR